MLIIHYGKWNIRKYSTWSEFLKTIVTFAIF